MGKYSTGVVLLLSGVSVPYETKESSAGQSGFTDFEYDISTSIKRCFPVVQDENSSYNMV